MIPQTPGTNTSLRAEVISALRQASAETGSDFKYLLGTAMRESSLLPNAHAADSSASGLFQFVQQTWLGMVKQYGAKFGLGSYAGAIQREPDGHYVVANQADRAAILSLRNDPKISALMAGEYTQQTRCQMQARLGRDVCGGELYAAHFLGAPAACKLIEMANHQPDASAAACFPAAAAANRTVFFHANGTPKTVGEVYQWALKQPGTAYTAARRVLASTPASSRSVNQLSPADLEAARQGSNPVQSFFAAAQAPNDLSTLGLFRDAPASAPLDTAPIPQTPFALSPEVMSVLVALDPASALSTSADSKTS
ncbi:MAG: lytic transglycosylase domain-containing protein [Alphaproteobacteria bacterium]|nr:lytic transglycosylase domain-containing protein [Alphaproteobacteria bacterium]